MKYSNTGKFTAKQKKLAEEISQKIDELKGSGCEIYGKGFELLAYKKSEMKHAHPMHESTSSCDFRHKIKELYCGNITDSGADDEEHFQKGYITEE